MVKGKYGSCGRAGSGARLFRGEDSFESRDYENGGKERQREKSDANKNARRRSKRHKESAQGANDGRGAAIA